MTDRLKSLIALLPRRPGVYLMKDADGNIIYIGKAKSLAARVSQYFLRPQAGKVAAMVAHVASFETILTGNEKEAFILEMNLIKEHAPRYNVLLKDGKHYPYIALKKKGDPVLRIARSAKDKSYDYFGPFPTSRYAFEVMSLLNKIFPTRKCRRIPAVPCLYWHLGQCLAPCINKIDEETYHALYLSVRDFLSGKTGEVRRRLREDMLKASGELNFERAADLKETLKAIDQVSLPQGVESKDKVSRDVFAYAKREGYLALGVLTYRRGILLGKEAFVVPEFGPAKEQIPELILQYYESHPLPREIIANVPAAAARINEVHDVKVQSAHKGKLLELVNIASLNAEKELDAHFMSARLKDDSLKLLAELGRRLGVRTPYRIDLFDNSHLQGEAAVGVLVAFTNGEPDKRLYRKYNIEGPEKRDDAASMREVLKRRYQRLRDEGGKMPDLIFLDGGLPQVRAGTEVLKELGLDIPLFGLYKNDKHRTEGVIDREGRTYDLTDDKPLFFLLVRMQDEVHRYAIGFHRQKRGILFREGPLEHIPGLGLRRKALLYEHYPSLEQMRAASALELSQILPEDVARRVYDRLREGK